MDQHPDLTEHEEDIILWSVAIYLCGEIRYCSSALIPHTSILRVEMTILDRF